MMSAIEDMAILRLPEVMKLVGLGRSSIYQMMKDGNFPRSVSLGPRSVGWRTGDVRTWLAERVTA